MRGSGCLRAFGRPEEEWEAGEENKEGFFPPRLLSTKGGVVTLHSFSPNLPWQKQLLEQLDLCEGRIVYFNDLYAPEVPGEAGDLHRSPVWVYTYIFVHIP